MSNLAMDRFVIPPSPNWHLCNILAISDNGLLAYGTKGDVTIIEVKKDKNFEVSFIKLAHKEKLHVVVFSPIRGNFKNCIATCGDDGMVHVWDFEKPSLLFSHTGHTDGMKVQGLDWSRADTNRLVSINEAGSIVVWDLASNTIRKLQCGVKVSPLCLSCCPHDKDLIAVGCKGGVTLVFDIKGSGKLMHRLRGHDQDVISVSWCPVPFNVFKHKRDIDSNTENKDTVEDKPQELLLATGGIEKSIFIWRTTSDGRFEIVLNLPSTNIGASSFQRKKGVQGYSQLVMWTCVLWVDAYTLLSTSLFGELLSWDLSKVTKEKTKKIQPRLLHSRHYKGCFSIACPIVFDEVREWRSDKRVVWSTAMDKRIVSCSLASGDILLDIPTLGGGVFCMAFSPLDPNRLAIGSSDCKVFVWNMSDISALNLTDYWRKIVGKVMALCWHPTEENWLAYGTSDGHVGLLDLGSNKFPTIFRLHHRKSVYRLFWGLPLLSPVGDSKSSRPLVLYSVGDRDIFQYTANPQEPDEEPLSLNAAVLNDIDLKQGHEKVLTRSEMIIKQDNSLFVVGCENGVIYVLDCKTTALKHSIYAHKKLVNNLEWHPETVTSDNNISPYKDWLASASDVIKVHSFSTEGEPELVATFTGHSLKIVGLAWSPHFNGRLVSSSYDCTAQVWDVVNQSCLGVFTGHNLPVMSVLFSPEDPDLIVSSSLDMTVQLWSTSQLSIPTSKPDKKKDRATKNRPKGEKATEVCFANFDLHENGGCSERMEQVYHNGSNDKSELPLSTQSKFTLNNAAEKGKEENKELEQRQRYYSKVTKSSLFPVTGSQIVQGMHFDELLRRWSAGSASGSVSVPDVSSASDQEECEQETKNVEDLNYLDLFGDEKSMRRLLAMEENKLMENKNYHAAYFTALWQGDVSKMIQGAITKKKLNDWLVSIAPIAGFEVWEQACEAYAAQLVECGDVVKASSYLLVIHKVHEAIRLLSEHMLHREAVAVAKCRLAADDPLVAQVYDDWGNQLKHHGRFSVAAHCYLAANNPVASIEALSRSQDLKSLMMAATLAKHIGKIEQAKSLALDCLTMCAAVPNYSVGQQILVEMPQYQYWNVWLKASDILSKVKNRSEMEIFKRLDGQIPGQTPLLEELSASCSPQSGGYQKLLSHLSTNKTPEFPREMWFFVSGQLAAACAAKQEAGSALFLLHLVSAFSAAFHFQTLHAQSLTLPNIITLLMPNGIFAKDSIILVNCETEEEKQLMKSLKAFLFASIIHWMNNNWAKVESILMKKKTSKLKGGGDTNIVEEKQDCIKMNWLPELITKYSGDILDSNSVKFFVKKAQKQQLQTVVADLNIQRNRLVNLNKKQSMPNNKSQSEMTGTEKSENAERSNVTEQCTKESVEQVEDTSSDKELNEAIVKKLNNTANNTSQESVNSSESQKDCSEQTKSLDIDTAKNNTDEVQENKSDGKLEVVTSSCHLNGDNTNISVTNGKTENKSLQGENKATTLNLGKEESTKPNLKRDISPNNENAAIIEKEVNEKVKEIDELDKDLQKFEAERLSAPSPFIAYANIKYLIDNLVKPQDASLAQHLQENCDQLWKQSALNSCS